MWYPVVKLYGVEGHTLFLNVFTGRLMDIQFSRITSIIPTCYQMIKLHRAITATIFHVTIVDNY